MEYVKQLIKEQYPTFIEDSLYRCDDGLTFMFKIDDSHDIYRCYLDEQNKRLVFI